MVPSITSRAIASAMSCAPCKWASCEIKAMDGVGRFWVAGGEMPLWRARAQSQPDKHIGNIDQVLGKLPRPTRSRR